MTDSRQPQDDEPRSNVGWLWLGAIAAVGALIGWLFSEYGDRFDWGKDGPSLAYILLVLVLVLSSFTLRRTHLVGALRSLLAWAMIGLVVVIGYSYRHELKSVWYRVAGELDPSRPVPAETMAEPNQSQGEGRALSIRQAADGHYYVNARINGADMRLLVDTGATVTVLSVRQAERAGIFPSQSEFTATVRTASGMARAAPVRIRDLQIGDARLEDVPALVMDTPRDLSVLGVGTLQRFKSYEVRDGVLTLKW